MHPSLLSSTYRFLSWWDRFVGINQTRKVFTVRKIATFLAVLLPLGMLTTASPGLSIEQEEHFKGIKANLVEALGPQIN